MDRLWLRPVAGTAVASNELHDFVDKEAASDDAIALCNRVKTAAEYPAALKVFVTPKE